MDEAACYLPDDVGNLDTSGVTNIAGERREKLEPVEVSRDVYS